MPRITPVPVVESVGIRVPHDSGPDTPVRISTGALRGVEVLDRQLGGGLPHSLMHRVAQCLGVRRTGSEFEVPVGGTVVASVGGSSRGPFSVHCVQLGGPVARVGCSPATVTVHNGTTGVVTTVHAPHRLAFVHGPVGRACTVWITTTAGVQLFVPRADTDTEDDEPAAKRARGPQDVPA